MYEQKYAKYKYKYMQLKKYQNNQLTGGGKFQNEAPDEILDAFNNIDSESNRLSRIHHLSIQNPADCPTFDYIESGIKTVEGRANSPKYHSYQKGDTLIFEWQSKTLKTIITDIKKYQTLEDYLDAEGFKKALPCVESFDEAIKIYNRWSNTDQRENYRKKYGYGFLGIHIDRIN